MFDEDGLGNYGTDATRTRKSGDGRDEMDNKGHEIAHFLIVARNRKLADFRQISNSPWTSGQPSSPGLPTSYWSLPAASNSSVEML